MIRIFAVLIFVLTFGATNAPSQTAKQGKDGTDRDPKQETLDPDEQAKKAAEARDQAAKKILDDALRTSHLTGRPICLFAGDPEDRLVQEIIAICRNSKPIRNQLDQLITITIHSDSKAFADLRPKFGTPGKVKPPAFFIFDADVKLLGFFTGKPDENYNFFLNRIKEARAEVGATLDPATARKLEAALRESKSFREKSEFYSAAKIIAPFYKLLPEDGKISKSDPLRQLKKYRGTIKSDIASIFAKLAEDIRTDPGADAQKLVDIGFRITDAESVGKLDSEFAESAMVFQEALKTKLHFKNALEDFRTVKKIYALKGKASPESIQSILKIARKHPKTSLQKDIRTFAERRFGIDEKWNFCIGESRNWQSKKGEHSIYARPIACTESEIVIEDVSGRLIRVDASKLSQSDIDWIRAAFRTGQK